MKASGKRNISDNRISRLSKLGAALTVAIALGHGGAAQAAIDLDALAKTATEGAHTPTEKVAAAVAWTHQHMTWNYTDYKKRTVEQIVEQKGGNCFEQTLVVQDILSRVGVKTRRIREINIQPPSERRRGNAAERVAATGLSASVFGYQHNDHVWIEYFDADLGQWQPADPTTNVIGIAQWEDVRMGFAPRGKADVVALEDMIATIGVLAEVEGQPKTFENRSQYYLVDSFGKYVRGAKTSSAWPQWTQTITAEQGHIEGAFKGEYNLGQDDDGPIENLRRAYETMKTESAKPRKN